MVSKSEDRILADCHAWLWNTYPESRYKCWHVANERFTPIPQSILLYIENLLKNCGSIAKFEFVKKHIAKLASFDAMQRGSKLKAKGVLAGVPDYVVNHNGLTYYFEFKTDNGILSKEQKNIIDNLEYINIKCYIVRSIDEFKTIIKSIYEPIITT